MIGICGGGISGLAVGWHLDRLGVPFVLFEEDERVGGVIRSERADGVPLDVGPQRTRLTEDVRVLVEDAGLEDRMLVGSEELPLYVYRHGALHEVPFSIRTAFTTDLLGWREKLRVLREPFTPGARSDETVADFFVRKFGEGAYRAMIGPLYGGLYGSDPSRMMARHGLRTTLEHFGVEGSLLFALLRRGRKARATLPTVSFEDGMEALPRALAKRLGDRVRSGTAVRSVAAGGEGGAPFRIVTADGAVEVDRVVVSLPAPVAADVLAETAPEAARRIGRLRYNRLAVAHLVADESPEAGGRMSGLGYQVAFGEGLFTRGVTWNGAVFDRGGLCAAYLGGMWQPEVVDWPDERIADVAVEEFRRVTGRTARPVSVARTWIPAWDRSWDALDGLRLPEGVHLCANWNARPGIPGRATAARRLAEEMAGGLRGV